MARKQFATKSRRPQPVRRKVEILRLDELTLDAQMQPRIAMSAETVEHYAQEMIVGDRDRVINSEEKEWPAIEVVTDGDHMWVVDGFHRVNAARMAGIEAIQAYVNDGEERDALRLSLKANATQGMQRTKEDLEHVIRRALEDEEWSALGVRPLAKLLGINYRTLHRHRERLESEGSIEVQSERVGADGKTYRMPRKRTTQSTLRPWVGHKKVDEREAITSQDKNLLVEGADLSPSVLLELADSLDPEGTISLVMAQDSNVSAMLSLAASVASHQSIGDARWYSEGGKWVIVTLPHKQRELLLPDPGPITFPSLLKALGRIGYVEV